VLAAAKPDQASSWRYSARDGGSQKPCKLALRAARPPNELTVAIVSFPFLQLQPRPSHRMRPPKLCSDTNDKNQVAPSRPLPRAHRLAIESKPPAGCSRSALDQDHNTPVATAKASCRAAD